MVAGSDVAATLGLAARTPMTSLADVLRIAQSEGRICPQPDAWDRLWQMLPGRQREGAGWHPPLPLILAAWWETSDAEKRERFLAHLQYAAERGVLDAVAAYLKSLRPEQWHGEP